MTQKLTFLVLFLIGVGCTSSTQEKKVEEVVDENYDPILTPYFSIVEALIKDDFEKARTYGLEVSKATSDTGVKLALTGMGTLMAEASSSYDQRAILEQFGMVIPLYLEQSIINDYPIYTFKCKNEFDEKEVFWFSLSKQSKNPFIGNNSGDCVEMVEEIKPIIK